MDKKSKILLGVFFLLFIISTALTYYRTMVARDYGVIEPAPTEPVVEESIEILPVAVEEITDSEATTTPEENTVNLNE